MTEILFLWFGIVAVIYGFDLMDRDHPLCITVLFIGGASIGFYILSVFTLP